MYEEAEALRAAAVEMARGAGRVVMEGYDSAIEVTYKKPHAVVSQADRDAEVFILKEIQADFPGHQVLAEESGIHEGSFPYRWVVDPLDGTANFVRRIPHFCVMLAVQEQGAAGSFETVVAVIYDPVRKEIFSAVKGKGAQRNGIPIAVSRNDSLRQAIGATGFPPPKPDGTQANIPEFAELNRLTSGVRRTGCAGLDLAYVACGRFEFFWQYKLHEWDVEAGLLLVREAGGMNINLAQPGEPTERSILASNAALHDTLKNTLADVR